MRILLIANFLPDRQQSMQRFSEMLKTGLTAGGHEVEVLRPEPGFSRLLPEAAVPGKWLGYLDKFVVFPWVLASRVRASDVVHICDHSNSMYTRFLRGRPNVVTCHDLLAVRSALGEVPQNPTGWSGRKLQRSILRGLRRAQFVACVSEQTMSDVRRLAGREESATVLIHNGLNYPYEPMQRTEARARARQLLHDPERPFFLHVGGNQWYKNRLGALEILACLRSRGQFLAHRLVMVGKPFTAPMRSFIQQGKLDDHIVELNDLPNEDLRALYSLAEGLIFPSLEEGFGWPVVEAQACGCPVFTSNRQPMMEVGGPGAVYFDATDPSAAAAAVIEGLERRERMVVQGFENARRFSADAMIEAYAELYRAISPAPSRSAD